MNTGTESKFTPPPLPEIHAENASHLWYYADSERRPIGPLPFEELKRLMAEGSIALETLVIAEGSANWTPYAEVLRTQLPPIPVKEEELKLGKTGRALAGGGGCAGMIVGSIGLLMGVVFCATGIGAILGIPMIIGSLLFMGLGGQGIGRSFLPNKKVLRGNCPYCQHPKIEVDVKTLGLDCPACQKRIVIRDKRFIRVG